VAHGGPRAVGRGAIELLADRAKLTLLELGDGEAAPAVGSSVGYRLEREIRTGPVDRQMTDLVDDEEARYRVDPLSRSSSRPCAAAFVSAVMSAAAVAKSTRYPRPMALRLARQPGGTC
jgi:hypothetical protein